MSEDCITCAIAAATDDLTAFRLVRLIEQGELRMPLELKGLKDKALAAKRNIDRLHRAYDAFNEAAPVHARDVESIAGDIDEMNVDLGAATRILGNATGSSLDGSVDASQKSAGAPKEPPAAEQLPGLANQSAAAVIDSGGIAASQQPGS